MVTGRGAPGLVQNRNDHRGHGMEYAQREPKYKVGVYLEVSFFRLKRNGEIIITAGELLL